MKENPFNQLIGLMREEGKAYNPPSILLAEVISPSPLVIKVGDLQIDKDNLKVADYLLLDYKRQYQSSSDDITYGTTNYIKFKNTVSKGDILAVMPTADRQTFVILARVVNI